MLGEKILQLRKGNGLSQEELASQLTVSRQAISKWELGESVPDTENVVQLSKLFGVSTDYLLNDEYESDKDIPAVKTNAVELQKEYADKSIKKMKLVGWILSGVGLLSILTFFILSTMISSINFDAHSPNSKGGNQNEITLSGNTTADVNNEETTRPVKAYSFVDFITVNRLEALFGLSCLLLLAGVVFQITANIKMNKQKAKKTVITVNGGDENE